MSISLVKEFEKVIRSFNTIIFGDEDQDVVVDGITKPTISKIMLGIKSQFNGLKLEMINLLNSSRDESNIIVSALRDLHDQGVIDITSLEQAIEAAQQAGAGANGWTDSLILTDYGITQRLLNSQLKTYIDNFPFYLKHDPMTLDYSETLRTALLSGRPIVLTEGATYPMLSPVVITDMGKNVQIHGKNANFKYMGEASGDVLISITHSAALIHSYHNFDIDCNSKMASGLRVACVANNPEAASKFYSNRLTIRSCRKNATGQFGDALLVRGAFREVIMDYPSIDGVAMAAGTGVAGSSGVSGITVSQYDNDSYCEYFEIRSPTIKKVWSEDDTYTADQDGIKYFSGNGGIKGRKSRGKMVVWGGLFENCWGRSVKLQCLNAVMYGPTFKRNEGNVTKQGNGEVDSQTGNCSVHGATYIYEKGHTGGACVSFGADVNNNRVGGTAQDCDVYLDDETVLPMFVSNHPRGGSDVYIKAENNRIHGKAIVFSNSLVNGNRNIFKYIDNSVDEIVPTDHGNGNLMKAFNLCKASGSITPRTCRAEIHNNSIKQGDDTLVSLDGLPNVSVFGQVSSSGNQGMMDDPKGTTNSSGAKTRMALRAETYQFGSTLLMQNGRAYIIPSGETVEVQFDGLRGGMFMVGLVDVVLSQMIVSVAGDNFAILTSHNVPAQDAVIADGFNPAKPAVNAVNYVKYTTAKPTVPIGLYLDIWRHNDQGGKFYFRNNNASTRTLFVVGVFS